MKILNASRNSVSFMLDNGQLVTVDPGMLSGDLTATIKLIKGIVTSGTPEEVAIIIMGSYDQMICNQVTGSAPYIYTSETEARSKLIDPTVNYKEEIVDNQMAYLKNEVTELQNKLTEKDSELEHIKSLLEISEGRVKTLESDETTNLKIRKYIKEIDELRKELNQVKGDYNGELSKNTIHTREIQKLELEKKSLESNLELAKNKIEELNSKLGELLDQSETIDRLTKELEETKKALKEAQTTVANQKKLFNKAVDKFNLKLDDDGNWYQESAE